MDKDLYIEFLESEIRRIRAGANTHYGQSIGWMDEMEDLKLENDRLKKRDEIMLKFVKSAYCREMSCDDCMLYDHTKTTLYKCAYNGSDFFYDISAIAGSVLQEIDNNL